VWYYVILINPVFTQDKFIRSSQVSSLASCQRII